MEASTTSAPQRARPKALPVVENEVKAGRRRGRWLVACAAAATLTAVGCQSSGGPDATTSGTVRFLFTAGLALGAPADDVEEIRVDVFDVVGLLVASNTVPIRSDQPNPADPGGPLLRGADAFFTLRPGAYRIAATPLRGGGFQSEDCARAEGMAVVTAGTTTEVVLVMLCGGEGTGGLDVVGVLQHFPIITDLDFHPSKWIRTCDRVLVRLEAVDSDGDALTWLWSVASAPAGASYRLSGSGPAAWFASETPGSYQVRASVSDPGGHTASLQFPIHVTGELTRCIDRDQDGDGVPDLVDNCPLVANADQADEDGNGVGDLCEAIPQTASPAGLWPSQIAARLDRTPVHLTGPADVAAFLSWAARSPSEDRELVRAEIQAAAGNDEVARGLGEEVLAAERTDHSRALVALSVLGEMRNPAGEQFLAAFVSRPLPQGERSVEGDVPAETAMAILQAKAISGLAYRRTQSANLAVLEAVSKHPSIVVRAEAIRTYLFNNDFGDEAVRRLQAVVRREDLRYIDRVYRQAGDNAQTFDTRLSLFLEKHPEAVAPDPELGQGHDDGGVIDPFPNPSWFD